MVNDQSIGLNPMLILTLFCSVNLIVKKGFWLTRNSFLVFVYYKISFSIAIVPFFISGVTSSSGSGGLEILAIVKCSNVLAIDFAQNQDMVIEIGPT